MGFSLRFVKRCLFVTSLFILFSSAAYAQQGQEDEKVSEEYILGAGDVLEVAVYGEEDISREVFVRIDGRISLPLAGEVKAAGITPAELGEKLTEKLSRFLEEPNVTVILTESRSKAYYIVGEVQNPGEYQINRPVTVLQAIARAGGFREWAKKDRIMIVSGPDSGDEKVSFNGNEKISYFNYDRFLKDETGKDSLLVRPGDTIVIP